jgi:hypothetical protein
MCHLRVDRRRRVETKVIRHIQGLTDLMMLYSPVVWGKVAVLLDGWDQVGVISYSLVACICVIYAD